MTAPPGSAPSLDATRGPTEAEAAAAAAPAAEEAARDGTATPPAGAAKRRNLRSAASSLESLRRGRGHRHPGTRPHLVETLPRPYPYTTARPSLRHSRPWPSTPPPPPSTPSPPHPPTTTTQHTSPRLLGRCGGRAGTPDGGGTPPQCGTDSAASGTKENGSSSPS